MPLTFTFLQEDIESVLLFATAPVYLVIVGMLQAKNLKILAEVKRKGIADTEKIRLKKELRKLKLRTPVFMLAGSAVHIILYLLFAASTIRSGYFISICVMYAIYILIAWINFYLKGAGILKDIGDFNGLPGN